MRASNPVPAPRPPQADPPRPEHPPAGDLPTDRRPRSSPRRAAAHLHGDPALRELHQLRQLLRLRPGRHHQQPTQSVLPPPHDRTVAGGHVGPGGAKHQQQPGPLPQAWVGASLALATGSRQIRRPRQSPWSSKPSSSSTPTTGARDDHQPSTSQIPDRRARARPGLLTTSLPLTPTATASTGGVSATDGQDLRSDYANHQVEVSRPAGLGPVPVRAVPPLHPRLTVIGGACNADWFRSFSKHQDPTERPR